MLYSFHTNRGIQILQEIVEIFHKLIFTEHEKRLLESHGHSNSLRS